MQEARKTNSKNLVRTCKIELAKCDNCCMDKYNVMVQNEDVIYKASTIIERIRDNIMFAEKHCGEYLELLKG